MSEITVGSLVRAKSGQRNRYTTDLKRYRSSDPYDKMQTGEEFIIYRVDGEQAFYYSGGGGWNSIPFCDIEFVKQIFTLDKDNIGQFKVGDVVKLTHGWIPGVSPDQERRKSPFPQCRLNSGDSITVSAIDVDDGTLHYMVHGPVNKVPSCLAVPNKPQITVGSRVRFLKDNDAIVTPCPVRYKNSGTRTVRTGEECVIYVISGQKGQYIDGSGIKTYINLDDVEFIKQEFTITPSPTFQKGDKVKVAYPWLLGFSVDRTHFYGQQYPLDRLEVGDVLLVERMYETGYVEYKSASGNINTIPGCFLEIFVDSPQQSPIVEVKANPTELGLNPVTTITSSDPAPKTIKYKAGDWVRLTETPDQYPSPRFFKDMWGIRLKKGDMIRLWGADQLSAHYKSGVGVKFRLPINIVKPAASPHRTVSQLILCGVTILGGTEAMNVQYLQDPVILNSIRLLVGAASLTGSYVLFHRGVLVNTGKSIAAWSDRKRRLRQEGDDKMIAAIKDAVKGKV